MSDRTFKRFAQLFRLMGSPVENEAIAALMALRRVLPETGLGFSDVSVLIENHQGEIEEKKYSDVDAKIIFERGLEQGRSENTQCKSDYIDEDWLPRWSEILEYLQNDKQRLNPKEQELIDEWQARIRWRSPTLPTGGYLLSIFFKTKGSLR